MKPTRRIVAVASPFDPVTFLCRMLTSPDTSVRFGAVYGLSRHASDPKARLALLGAERGDASSDVRLAAKRVLDGNV